MKKKHTKIAHVHLLGENKLAKTHVKKSSSLARSFLVTPMPKNQLSTFPPDVFKTKMLLLHPCGNSTFWGTACVGPGEERWWPACLPPPCCCHTGAHLREPPGDRGPAGVVPDAQAAAALPCCRGQLGWGLAGSVGFRDGRHTFILVFSQTGTCPAFCNANSQQSYYKPLVGPAANMVEPDLGIKFGPKTDIIVFIV